MSSKTNRNPGHLALAELVREGWLTKLEKPGLGFIQYYCSGVTLESGLDVLHYTMLIYTVSRWVGEETGIRAALGDTANEIMFLTDIEKEVTT